MWEGKSLGFCVPVTGVHVCWGLGWWGRVGTGGGGWERISAGLVSNVSSVYWFSMATVLTTSFFWVIFKCLQYSKEFMIQKWYTDNLKCSCACFIFKKRYKHFIFDTSVCTTVPVILLLWTKSFNPSFSCSLVLRCCLSFILVFCDIFTNRCKKKCE